MAKLRPFRDYDEKDVINLYSMDLTTGTNAGGAISLGSDWSGRLSHGHLVAVGGAGGWNKGQELHEMLGDAGAGSSGLTNVTTQRYGVTAKLRSAGGALVPLGMTLFHVAQYDENGEQLKFNPRKASELEACIVGQAVPVVTRGLFLVNGIDESNQGDGNPVAISQSWLDAGGALYAGANGSITTGVNDGSNALTKIGRALGLDHSDGDILIKLEL
jgi:hypothetical protein